MPNDASIPLLCQMMCACGCAYYINAADGSYSPPSDDPFGQAIGWHDLTSASVCLSTPAPKPDVSAALVAVMNVNIDDSSTDAIVVAFRGTQPLTNDPDGVIDWLKDFLGSPVVGPSPIRGKVHSGFLSDTQSVLSGVIDMINNLQSNYTDPLPVIITGHSKGAAMATLCTALIVSGKLLPQIPYAVYTFGSPYPGDSTFAAYFESNIGVPVYRTENYLDIVPFLLPSATLINALEQSGNGAEALLGILLSGYDNDQYAPIGTLQFIQMNGTFAPPGTFNNSDTDIVTTLGQPNGFATVGDAHNHNCGYGYMNGSCGATGVCSVSS